MKGPGGAQQIAKEINTKFRYKAWVLVNLASKVCQSHKKSPNSFGLEGSIFLDYSFFLIEVPTSKCNIEENQTVFPWGKLLVLESSQPVGLRRDPFSIPYFFKAILYHLLAWCSLTLLLHGIYKL